MVQMVKMSGVRRVKQALRKRVKRGNDAGVIVGYFGVDYAVYVHENLKARHTVGQAKFLEQPAREMASELGKIVRKVVAGGGTMLEGLMLAGLALQRASQELVPVDLGHLKGSADTREE